MGKWTYRNPRPSLGTLLHFPDHQHRAWVIRPIGAGDFRAEVEGGLDPADDGYNLTGAGSLSLVQDVLQEHKVRRGLPVVIVEGSAS